MCHQAQGLFRFAKIVKIVEITGFLFYSFHHHIQKKVLILHQKKTSSALALY